MPVGKFQNVVWDAAIEHFTIKEMEEIFKNIKERLTPNGILSGYTIIRRQDGSKSLERHEYEFLNKQDLFSILNLHFKKVTVFETSSHDRVNLYFWASDGAALPFREDWTKGVTENTKEDVLENYR